MSVFKARLKGIGKLVAMLSRWRKPQYLTRSWCVFEQYTAYAERIPVEMIMPAEEIEGLKKQLNEEGGLDTVMQGLGEIDIEKTEATKGEDKVKVDRAIEDDVGSKAVNDAVRKSMKRMLGDA